MFYHIFSIIAGVIVLINVGLSIYGKLAKKLNIIIDTICAVIFITIGILGFVLPEKYELALTIVLFCLTVLFILETILFIKQRNNKNKTKEEPTKE